MTNAYVITQNLVDSLKTVSRAVDKKSPLPVLTHVLFKTDGESNGRITLFATNFEIGLVTWVGSKCEQPFDPIALPCDVLLKVLPKLFVSNERLDITVDLLEVTFQQGDTKYVVTGMDGSEFPVLPDPTTFTPVWSDVPADKFMAAVKHVLPAIGSDENRIGSYENRFVLNNVLVESDGRLVCANGYALHSALVDCMDPKQSFLLPKTAITTWLKVMDKGLPLEFAVNDDGRLLVSQTNLLMIAQKSEGRFPDWQMIVPKSSDHNVTLYRKDVIAVLDGLLTIAAASANTVLFAVEPAPSPIEPVIVTLSAKSDLGYAEKKIYGTGTVLEKVTVALNGAYVLQNARVHGDTLTYWVQGNTDPVRIVNEDGSFEDCIMPMSVGR